MNAADWKQRPEGGGFAAIWLIRAIARGGGRLVARSLLWPITAYFLLLRGRLFKEERPYRNFADFMHRMARLGPAFWQGFLR